MIDITSSRNGDGSRILHGTATSVAVISSSLGLIIFFAGFISGFVNQRDSISAMQANVAAMQTNIAAIRVEMSALSVRLTRMEDKADYTAQAIAELKVLLRGQKQ